MGIDPAGDSAPIDEATRVVIEMKYEAWLAEMAALATWDGRRYTPPARASVAVGQAPTIDDTDYGSKLCYFPIRDGEVDLTIDSEDALNVAVYLDLDANGLLLGVEIIDGTGREKPPAP